MKMAAAICQNQDLRDFMIGQDWDISNTDRFQSWKSANLENPDSDEIALL